MKQLTIHLPSIAPLAFYPDEQLQLPALQMLYSRGRSQSSSSRGDCSIFEVLGMAKISFARLRLMGEEQQPERLDGGYWYCADPVNLQADRDQVVLSHADSINIQEEEADALIASFNELFAQDGIELWRSMTDRGSTRHTGRWYLYSDKPWRLVTTPLGLAEGRSIRELMPQGEDAQRWRKLLTELEMLFFSNQVNQQRNQRGEAMINSLWLWGMQQEMRESVSKWDLLVGKHPLLKGVHKLEGVKLLEPSAPVEDILSQSSNALIVIDDLLRIQRSAAHHKIKPLLEELEQRIFEPALRALREGKLNRLTIQPANGSICRIKRHHLMRFWRKTKMVWAST